ncbi:MAG: diol dehydratase small subunit [Actinomycetota bacterium]|nr:diol dehydratase small subunit [Actinomycetota bacterium]
MAELSYPLSDGARDAVRSRTGRRVSEITLVSVLEGALSPADVAVSPETLRLQADFAAEGGNPQLADNLRRGAELTVFSDDELLQFYEMLRPGRSSADELDSLAATLDERGAAACAALVREARDAYVRRGLVA